MLLSGVFEAVLSSQQMAQELVWDGGGLRLPDPLSLSLLLSPPPACSSCPGSSWSPDGRQFLLRADLSCPVAWQAWDGGQKYWFTMASPLAPGLTHPLFLGGRTPGFQCQSTGHMLSGLSSIPSLESFLPPQCPPWRGSVAKSDGEGVGCRECLEASKGTRNQLRFSCLWHSQGVGRILQSNVRKSMWRGRGVRAWHGDVT